MQRYTGTNPIRFQYFQPKQQFITRFPKYQRVLSISPSTTFSPPPPLSEILGIAGAVHFSFLFVSVQLMQNSSLLLSFISLLESELCQQQVSLESIQKIRSTPLFPSHSPSLSLIICLMVGCLLQWHCCADTSRSPFLSVACSVSERNDNKQRRSPRRADNQESLCCTLASPPLSVN